MSKIILKFDAIEEADQAQQAQKAGDYHSVLWDFDQWLRARLKHEELSDQKREALQEARSEFADLLAEYNVEL